MRQEIVVAQKHLLRFVIQAAKAVRLTLAAAACCWLSPLVHAQPYPNKPIRIVVGLAAGGGSDLVARLVGQKLSERLGQPVIVDNKPGTSGIIAAELVAKSPADGYTLMLSPSGPMVFNPIMYTGLSYSPTRDFVPISMIVSFPLMIVVDAKSPIKSVKELVDFARLQPDKANYAASGSAFQLASELFNQRAGTRIAYIPYKSTSEGINAVISGDVMTTIADIGPASTLLKAGRLRGLAVTTSKRMAQFPAVPTLAEAGYPGFEIEFWMALFAPAATPPAVVQKLQTEVRQILELPDLRERFLNLSLVPATNTPDEMRNLIETEISRWSGIARSANIKPNN